MYKNIRPPRTADSIMALPVEIWNLELTGRPRRKNADPAISQVTETEVVPTLAAPTEQAGL